MDRFNVLQMEFLDALPDTLKKSFVFGGGTALSEFYLRHRHSDDLDFVALDMDMPVRLSEIKGMMGSMHQVVNANKIYDRCIFTVSFQGTDLKIEFVPLYFQRLSSPQVKGDLYVESLEDLAANKVLAMSDRTDVKDLVDMFWLTGKLKFNKALELAIRKSDMPLYYTINSAKYLSLLDRKDMLKIAVQITSEELGGFLDHVDACVKQRAKAGLGIYPDQDAQQP